MKLPSNDPDRLASLRAQDGRTRAPSPALQSVLGGATILPGREAEAMTVWQSLCARARGGDVAASEDLATLTLLLANDRSAPGQATELRRLTEAALEAVVLPRHRQEQLGRLVRLAVKSGDRAEAHARLAAMVVDAPDIESDSEHRVSAAAVATLDGRVDEVFALLGRRRADIPIDGSLDPLATVLRANAHELNDQVDMAVEVLRELPHPSVLDAVRSSYASLGLCARSTAALETSTRNAAIQRGASGGRGTGFALGVAYFLVGLLVFVILFFGPPPDGLAETLLIWLVALVFTLAGAALVWRGIQKGRRVAYLRAHGLPLAARVLETTATGMKIGHVPVYRLRLLVAGPGAPYEASVEKMLHADEVQQIVGKDVGVRVHPNAPTDLMLDE